MFKYVLLFFLIPIGVKAQLITTAKQLSSQFEYFKENNPCEKLYLMPNRDIFHPGENLWFTGFLVDCEKLKFSEISQSINVYLIDPKSNVVAKSKILNQNGKFNGDLIIPDTIKPGQYELIGFSTLQKQTVSQDNYFRRYVDIVDRQGGNLKFEIHTDKITNVSVKAVNGGYINGLSFDCEYYDADGYILTETYVTGQNGEVSIDIAKNVTQIILRSNYRRVENTHYHQVKKVQKLDVQVIPKARQVVKGLPSTIYIKVVDEDGNPQKSDVKLFKGDEVIDVLETNNQGLGKIDFFKYPDEALALTINNNSDEFYSLPMAQERGTLFDFHKQGSSIVLNLYSNIDSIQNVYLMGHVRGKLQHASLINFKNSFTEVIDISTFDPGILELVLMDENKAILSNANIYIPPSNKSRLGLDLKKDSIFNKLSFTSDSLVGWFGIRVNNSDYVYHDRAVDIQTYFLIMSEMSKTKLVYREELDDYINTVTPERFEWFLNGESPKLIQTDKILGQDQIRGKAFYENEKPLLEKEIILYSQGEKLKSWFTKTNTQGEFSFEGVEAGTEDELILSALNIKRNRVVKFEILEDDIRLKYRFNHTSPDLSLSRVNTTDTIDFTNAVVLENITKKGDKYIEEVEERREKLDRIKTVKAEDIQFSGGGGRWGILSILQQVTSIYSWNRSTGQVLLRAPQTFSAGSGVIFYMDNTRMGDNMFNLNFLSLDQIDEIKVYRPGPDAVQFPFAPDGVIQIITKKGFNPSNEIKGKHLTLINSVYNKGRTYDIVENDPTRQNNNKPTIYWQVEESLKKSHRYQPLGKSHHVEIFGLTDESQLVYFQTTANE
ncbi:MAG: hypothetical protein ABJH05_09400 [Fulvivirga sp.]